MGGYEEFIPREVGVSGLNFRTLGGGQQADADGQGDEQMSKPDTRDLRVL